MPKPSLRENLLDAGHRLMWQTGYGATGVRDIVAEAGAPQGSFTNHFRSKEEFACEVLDRYFAYVSGLVADALSDASLSPTDRLRRYLDIITQKLDAADWSRGCMIGNFSLETSPQSERLRTKLSAIFTQWRAPFAAAIAEGQAAGAISSEFTPDDLADFLLTSWQGAILRMKVDPQSAAAGTLQENRVRNRVRKGTAMTISPACTHVKSTSSGPRCPTWRPDREGPNTLFSPRQSDVILHLAQHHSACRTACALHRARPDRLRPVGQAGHRLSLRSFMSAISMPSSNALDPQ